MRIENDIYKENTPYNYTHTNSDTSSLNENQTNNNNNRFKYIMIRLGIITIGLIAIILNSIYGYALPHSQVDCIIDYSHIMTTRFNNFFQNEREAKFLLLIISSLCVDLIMIILGLIWVFYGKSWRVFITLITFYSFKILIELIFQERRPDGYLWEYPGFPSIMVSYLNTNTLFYSTSTGFITIAMLEFWKMDYKNVFYFSLLVLSIDLITRNILRGNYIIDLLSAIILAHFIFILADEYCPKYLDNVDNEWFNLNSNSDDEDETRGYNPVASKEFEKFISYN